MSDSSSTTPSPCAKSSVVYCCTSFTLFLYFLCAVVVDGSSSQQRFFCLKFLFSVKSRDLSSPAEGSSFKINNKLGARWMELVEDGEEKITPPECCSLIFWELELLNSALKVWFLNVFYFVWRWIFIEWNKAYLNKAQNFCAQDRRDEIRELVGAAAAVRIYLHEWAIVSLWIIFSSFGDSKIQQPWVEFVSINLVLFSLSWIDF